MSVQQETAPLPAGVLLDGGEMAALLLARDMKADLLLMDERKGRAVAGRLGLAVTGTIGLLVEASRRGMVDFEAAVGLLLSQTNFRVDDSVISAARRVLGFVPKASQ